MPRIFYGRKDVDITWDCSIETENRQESEGNRPDLVVTDKKLKEINIRKTAKSMSKVSASFDRKLLSTVDSRRKLAKISFSTLIQYNHHHQGNPRDGAAQSPEDTHDLSNGTSLT